MIYYSCREVSMKKVLLALGLFAGVLALTGCGTETLSCTMTSKESGANMTQEINVTFDGNKAKTVEAIRAMEYPEGYADYMDTLKDSLDEQMPEYEEKYGVETDITVDGTTIKFAMKSDADKLNDKSKVLFGYDPEADGSKEATQKNFEVAGYTCK